MFQASAIWDAITVHTFFSGSITKIHLELKKTLFRNMYMSLTLTLCLHDICDTVRYKDVAYRVTAAPALAVDADVALGAGSVAVHIPSMQQWSRCMRQVVR